MISIRSTTRVGKDPAQMFALISETRDSTTPTDSSPVSPPDPELRNLKLFVWEENGETYFTYAPTRDVVFDDPDKPVKVLEIELIGRDNTPDYHKFWMAIFTLSDTRPLQKIECTLRKRDSSGIVVESPVPVSPGDSTFTQKVTRATLTFDLRKVTSTYLNVLVRNDAYPGRLISCDPQVENGTKTTG